VLSFSWLTLIDLFVKAIEGSSTDALAEKVGVSFGNQWRAGPLPEKVGAPGRKQKQPRHR
jgi:hypothetical protein